MRISILALLLLFSGCNRTLAAREIELAATERDAAHLSAQLDLLTRNLASLRAASQAEENRFKTSSTNLRTSQVQMVETWKGEAAQLKARKDAVKLPKNLSDALDLAQSRARAHPQGVPRQSIALLHAHR